MPMNLFNRITVRSRINKCSGKFSLALFLFFLCALLLTEEGLAQTDEMPFSAEPAPETSAYKAGFFIVQAPPGQAATETLLLKNDSDSPISLRIMSVDATTGPIGGVSYGLPAEPVTKVGTWIGLPVSEVTLSAGEEKRILFTITVPPDAVSGDHLGGLAVWLPSTPGESRQAGNGQVGATIETQLRRVLALHVVVPGLADPLIVINDVKPVVRPDGVYLEISIANQGRRLTKGNGFVELPENDFQRDFALETFVPGTSIAYPIKWMDNPEENTYPAHVVIHYEQFTAEWWGSFNVGPEITAQIEERQGSSGGNWMLLYIILGIGAAVVLLAAGIFVGRRLGRS